MRFLTIGFDRDDTAQGIDSRRRFTPGHMQPGQPVEQREILLVQRDTTLGRPVLVEVIGQQVAAIEI